MNKHQGKLLIEPKIKDFQDKLGSYLSKDFSETETRNRFIDPFFSALGWQMLQTDLPRKQWDVHREYSQRDNSSTKKPDYAFRVKNQDSSIFSISFFVESKAPSISLLDPSPIFQAKRYAYSSHGRAPIVILTNFHHLRVFDTSERPSFTKPFQGLLKYFDLKYTDYLKNWDILWDTFSKEAVYNGSLAKLRGKPSRETKSLDEEFLDDISKWRKILAQEIIRNNNISAKELNEATQRIIDRLVFIRNLEDRGIENEDLLLNICKMDSSQDVYKLLLPIFQKLNALYNGLLFKPHHSEHLHVSDEAIKKIIEDMSFPISPFRFDVIRPEILGRIYEKFLGSKIHVTKTKQVKILEKPEVVHAKGVYYTPEYIVSQIVEQTVGQLIQNKSPEEISKYKILDPACGSGSFLLGAFSYIVTYHEDWYSKHKSSKLYKKDFFIEKDGTIQLTSKKKAEILINNIYGVDIDNQATEVAMMSLYLKLLDEGFDKGQATLFLKGYILPDMSNNIKGGNSIVEYDIWDRIDQEDGSEQTSFYPKSQSKSTKIEDRISPFSYMVAFKDTLNGKLFDCVIGNPPYIDSEEMVKTNLETREYCASKYITAKGNWDMYCVFSEKAISLLNPNGYFSFIIPNKFISKPYGVHLKSLFSQYSVNYIFDYTEVPVFVCHNRKINVYPIVIVIHKTPMKSKGYYIKYIQTNDLLSESFRKSFKLSLNDTNWSKLFSTSHHNSHSIIDQSDRIDKHFEVENAASVSEAYILKELLFDKNSLSIDSFRFVNTGTIDRYVCLWGVNPTQYIKNRYQYPQVLKNAIKKTFPNRYYQFNKEKLILAGMVTKIEALYDNGCLFAGKSTTTISQKSGKYSLKYLLGYLNSDFFSRLYTDRNKYNAMSGGYLNCSKGQLAEMPFYELNLKNSAHKLHYNSVIEDVDSILSISKEFYFASQIDRQKILNNIEYIRNRIESKFLLLFNK